MRIKDPFSSGALVLLFLSLLIFPAAGKKKPAPKAPPPYQPVIIIDPGHGGKDPGAISKKKIREKEVVLSISKKLAASLKRKTGAKVFLTRSGDRFVSLDYRDRFANARSCDLFLSVHANASLRPRLQGMEIYYLNKATDEAARRLAARENEGAPQRESEIEMIVSDLIQTAATEESAELAQHIRRSLQGRLKKRYNIESIRIKTALFYVLVGAKCPSLLIETGFITNPKEGRRLKQVGFQRDLADAIAEGVARHLSAQSRPGSNL